jgi:hypothetical protein
MKKITLLFWLMLFFVSTSYAQLFTITECTATVDSNIYGPMYSSVTAGSTNRSAALYPSSQLTGIAGQTLNALYYKRLTAAGSIAGTPNFKVYMKEISAADYGSSSLDWATEIATATLVYNSNPSTSVGSSLGWKSFPMSTSFVYSGTQNLAVFTEYVNTTASANIGWAYEYSTSCLNTANSNTGKYNNNTTGTPSATLATSNYRRPLIGFDFVVSCNAPNALVTSNLTSSSVNVAWTENAIQPQNGYEYYLSTTNTAPLPATTPTGVTGTGVLSVSLSALPSGTTHYFWVRGNCGANDKSVLVGPLTFTTLCTEVTNFIQNFDTSTTGVGNLPNCWSKAGTSNNTYTTTGATSPMSPSNRLYMNISTTTSSYALMPPVSNLQANTHRLKFKAYATSTSKVLRLGYFTIPNDATSFVLLNQFQLPGTAVANTQEFTYVPTGIPAGVNQLVFSLVDGVSTTVYVDDVKWEAIPSCPEPTLLTVANVMSNSAVLGWTSNGSETMWQIEYGIGNFVQGTGTVINSVNTNPYVLSGLTSNTNYNFYVRAFCSTSDSSTLTGPFLFKTLCSEVTDFVENFDSWPTGSAAGLPDCWSKLGSGLGYLTTASATPMSAPNRLYTSISATTDLYILLPPVSNLQANTHRLKFKAYCTTASKTLSVGYFTTPSDLNTYVEIQLLQLPSTNLASTQEYTIIPIGIPAGVNQLVLKPVAGTVAVTYIDDVKWEVNSNCIEPTLLTAAFITNFSATLGWTNGGTETLWDIQYGLVNFALGSGTIVSGVTTNPFLLNGLTSNTQYQFYVRGVCSGPENSAWSGPFTFKSQCNDVTEFAESFEGYATGTANPLADCWSKLGNGIIYLTTGANAPMSPVNRLYMSASGTTPTEVLAVMPSVSNLQANTHRLRFKAYATTTNKFVEIGYLTNPSDLTSFIQIQEVFLPGTTLATTQEFTVVPGALPSGVKNLCFRNSGSPTGATVLYIDDVIWEAIPSCPEPNLLVSSMITNATANLGWTETATATQWEIEYGITGFTQGAGVIVSATTNPFILTGLLSNTTYGFYVRSVCNTSNSSVWTGPSTFKTQCDDVTEFSENFDSYATGSANPLADCWTKGGTGSVYINTGAVLPMSPANRLYMFASGTANPPTESLAIMPAVSNLQANTHRLKFKGYATLVDRVVQIGYLTDPNNVNTFVNLQNVTLPSTLISNTQEFTIVPTGIPAGVKNLAFKNPGFISSSATMYIDDVRWEAIPACPGPTSLMASNITSNSANLSWTEMGSATTWNVEYGPVGYTQGTGGTLISGIVTNPYTLTPLASATTFDYYVKADCGGTAGVSIWIGPYTFTTLCTAFVAPYVNNFDSLPLVTPFRSLPNCWETQVGPDYWTVSNDVINTGHTYLPNLGDHTTTTANYMWIDASSNITANEMVSPLIDISGLTSPYVGFWFASNNTTNTINHTIALDVWNGSAWLNIATQIGNFTSWVKVAAVVPSTVPTITKFRIYAIANPNGVAGDYFYNDLGVDDFFVEEAPILSADNFDSTSFTAYPNPVNDMLNLSYSSEIYSVKVINLLGQELFTKKVSNNSTQIDMSNLPAGTYIVNMTIDNAIKSIKVIKK